MTWGTSARAGAARRARARSADARAAPALVAIASVCLLAAVAGSAPTAVAAPAGIRPIVSHHASPGGRAFRLHEFRVTLAEAELRVVDVRMARALDRVLERLGAALVVNGGYYGLRGEPEGLAITEGRVVSQFLARLGGGVIAARDGRARLLDAERDPVPCEGEAEFAVQCKPRLVVDGRPNVRSDDGRRADRTALCLRAGGTVLDVVVARSDDADGGGGPTLYRFARLLAERGCEDALNLDGGPSTGVAWREARGIRFLAPRSPVRHALAVRLRGGQGR